MGFFNELGRRVETLKRTAEDAVDEHTTHRCEACDHEFDTQHDECPECGGELVVATE